MSDLYRLNHGCVRCRWGSSVDGTIQFDALIRGLVLRADLDIFVQRRSNRRAASGPIGCLFRDPLPQDLKDEWQCWRNSLHDRERPFVTRCYHPKEFGEITNVELHAFSDTSQNAIGVTIYLRLINTKGDGSVSLLFAQTKLTLKRSHGSRKNWESTWT